jgi:transcription elongation GreA/GreB family factor
MAQKYIWENGIVGAVQPIGPAPSEYQSILEKGDFDALEAELMAHIDSSPVDIAFFLPGYRLLVKKKEQSRAEALVQLHTGTLRERDEWAAETALCSALLGFWPDCATARDALLHHLKRMYAESHGYEKFAANLSVAQSSGLDTLRLFEAWLRFDEGRCVYMPSKGVGRVREVNIGLAVLRITFESGGQMSFKIDEAQRLCMPLSKDHFLAKKLDAPDEMRNLAKSAPRDLLALLFASVKRPLPLPELREMLSGLVPETGWTSWWASARKDPRITVGEGTRGVVTLNDSADDAAASILRRFSEADPRDKTDLFRKHGARSKDLAIAMLSAIVADANAALDSNPSLAFELAVQLQLLGKDAGIGLSFTPASLAGRDDSVALVAGMQDRAARKKAVALIGENRSDWPQAMAAVARRESDAQIIAFIYSELCDKGETEVVERVVSSVLDDPSSAPHFYLWLCKEMPGRPELKARANAEFLLALLRMLDNGAFKGYYTALRKLFDLGEAADWAVTVLSSDEAVRVLDALLREKGLEDYRKDRMRQEIYHVHPELQEKKKTLIYVTAESLEAKKTELETLVRVDLPHNSLEIKRTREFGDLRENFEYHAARARQEMLSSRAKSLHDELTETRAIDFQTVDTSKVTIGTLVSLREKSGGLVTMGLLGPWDSDPSKNILSYTSVAGNALLGLKTGENVRIGDKNYVLEKIEVWNNSPAT